MSHEIAHMLIGYQTGTLQPGSLSVSVCQCWTFHKPEHLFHISLSGGVIVK